MSGDPYKYFRIEARELVDGLSRGVLELEKGAAEPELVSRLLRYAHTLKGAARIVQQPKISELSHALEDVLAGMRDKPETLKAPTIGELLKRLDEIAGELAGLGGPAAAPSRAEPAAPAAAGSGADRGDEQLESVRVDMREMDGMLRGLSELRTQMSGLYRLGAELEAAAEAAVPNAGAGELGKELRALQRRLSAAVERSARELDGLHEQAEGMRLVAANSVFGLVERAARDAAEASGKQVAFEASGGATRLDARVLRLVSNALVHLARNAVSHGLESPAARARAAKPAAGRVRIAVERRGDRAIFSCEDDGRGVELERIKQVLLERKLASAAEASRLTPSAAMELLLRGGLSTARSVSEISGRGVGLDVVRAAVAALNGTVSGRSESGRGTRIEMSVPVMVESQEVLHVQAGSQVVSLPVQAVSKAARVWPRELVAGPEGQTLALEGQGVRFALLSRLLGGGQNGARAAEFGREAPGPLSVLLLETPAGRAAVGANHILGRERVVIRPLPRSLGEVPIVRGAFLTSEGAPQLVLSPEELVAAVQGSGAPPAARPAKRKPRLLVIDDSLTTRMLEQGILETAGYQVETAASAEEAFEKIGQQRYDAFIVDVEMPGMDGFEFVRRTRAQPQSAGIPAVMVTSRSAPQDRAQGLSVGAKAYIEKGRFDEKLLLRTIGELVGGPGENR